MSKFIKNIFNKYEIIYVDKNDDLWQKPVITEQQIFINIFKNKILHYNYFSFPWASYIDNIYTQKYEILENLINNEIKNKCIISKKRKYFTVVQHIHFRDYIETFTKLNIKYIFTPHKMQQDTELEKKYDIHIIPISLFPVQYNRLNKFCDMQNKKIMANFIGQINHEKNLTNIREKIFYYFKDKKNCVIKSNDNWFYEDNVYKNNNNTISFDEYYQKNILESKFTLCPLGTGPNSIRLWEALSYGSIPVILSDNLVLPILPNVNYSDCFVFWRESDINKLYDYLQTFTHEKIIEMSNKCIFIFNKFFSPKNMHKTIMHYFEKNINIEPENIQPENIQPENIQPENIQPENIQPENINTITRQHVSNYRPKIILITQYYIVNSKDIEYNLKRQEEIDFCLKQNCENESIDELHLFLEEDYDISFIKSKILIKKIISNKRLNYKDVFEYYNNNISNDICILQNADIYLDKSIEIVRQINFENDNLFIALNRYENNDNNKGSLLNGLEINEADQKNSRSILKPYQESIWSQDAWIWKNPIEKITSEFDFNLGVVGCDNYILYLMYKLGYKLLNCSKLICINHFDRLSIEKSSFGISKGNISKNRENRIGDNSKYIFLENQDIIPDKYCTKIENIFIKENPKIINLSIEQNISEININDSQVVSSSFTNFLYKTSNVLFNNKSYWEPEDTDEEPYIEFNFENLYEIVVIDISGKPLNREDTNFGYISKFKISYMNNNNKWETNTNIYTGIEINNGNYIKKIYLEPSIICKKIRIHPILHFNIKALKIKFYKKDYPKINIFDFLCKNKEYNKIFDKTYFDYKYLHSLNLKNDENKYEYKTNILGEQIENGICLFIYVMNRKENIINNIKTWLNQTINQLIIVDWNSDDNLAEFMKDIKDERLLYVRVINEKYFIRTYAQNLAASLCKFNKICKLDSDIILSSNFFENHPLNNGNFYVGEWNCARNENEKHTHGNIYLFTEDYFRINGYNEYIKGYGYDDTDFTIRLICCGLTKNLFNLDYLYHVPHDDYDRIKNLHQNETPLLMTFTNKFCVEKTVFWNNEFKLQKYNFYINNKNNKNIICDRIKEHEYKYDKELYDIAHEKAINLLKSWKIM